MKRAEKPGNRSPEDSTIRKKNKIKGALLNLLIFAFSVTLCFGISELVIRKMGVTDNIGQFYFEGKKIRPIITVPENLGDRIAKFLEETKNNYIRYDSYLGWTIGPNQKTKLYKSNSAGLRSYPKNYPFAPDPEKLRIAIFGDSFVHGDDVSYEQTWGFFLEQELKLKGINAEVLNFGVGGYGGDQAYLRYKQLGAQFSPDIVIIGFQIENFARNLNTFRLFYLKDSGIPLSKPRFILEGDELKIINQPAIFPGNLIDKIKNDPASFSRFDFFYKGEKNNVVNFFLKSRLIGLFVTNFGEQEESTYYYQEDKFEGEKIGLKIIQGFINEAEQNSSEAFIIHLPMKNHVVHAAKNKQLRHKFVLEKLIFAYNVIDPLRPLIDEATRAPLRSLFVGAHYSENGNRIIGKTISTHLINESKKLARFKKGGG